MFSALTMLLLAVVLAGVRPMADAVGYVLLIFTIFLTALGLISMMTTFAARVRAPEVCQFRAFPINPVSYFTSCATRAIDSFPNSTQAVAVVNPEAYVVHALRLLMYKSASIAAVTRDFASLAVFRAIMVVVATAAFRRAL